MIDTISGPSKERLLRILRILEESDRSYTSAELEALIGWPSHSIRKDISCLTKQGSAENSEPAPQAETGETSGGLAGESAGRAGTSAGYAPETLVPLIKEALGLDKRRTFCVVGLGRLGSAYLNLDAASLGEFELAAGFDTNVNRVEILSSPAPLYPAYKMADVIRRQGIEIALLCVPAGAAQATAEKLAAAGIRAILNFAPVILKLPPAAVAVRNVYVADELRSLAVKIN